MLGTGCTFVTCRFDDELGRIGIQTNERVLFVAFKGFMAFHTPLADSKPAVAIIGTKFARLPFAITILTISFAFELHDETNGVRLIA